MSKRRLLCTPCELRHPGGKEGLDKTALSSESTGEETHSIFRKEICEGAFFEYVVVLT